MARRIKQQNKHLNASPHRAEAPLWLKRKFSRLKACKRGNISLDIAPFARFEPRGFGSAHIAPPVGKGSKLSLLNEHQANERTFLAWIRTSIGIMAFGFVVEKFGLFVKQLRDVLSLDPHHPYPEHIRSPWINSSFLGIALIGLGLILVLLAFLNYKRIEREIKEGVFEQSFLLGTMLTMSILSIGIFVMLYLIRSA
ncbi:MAG: YidH family protein [Parachlamydiaceae bacterium]